MKKILILSIILLSINVLHAQPDEWLRKDDFSSGGNRYGAVGFSINDKGYIGTGEITFSGPTKNFKRCDQGGTGWTNMMDFMGDAIRFSVGFSIGTKGYIGTGEGLPYGTYRDDFWRYNSEDNTWTQRAAVPGGGRRFAVGFSILDKGYIGTGQGNSGLKNDFYEYDTAANSWSIKANLPGNPRAEACGFSIGDKGYAGTGFDGTYLNDFYEFDPTSGSLGTWTPKANFGGVSRKGATGFSIAYDGYIGTGYDGTNARKDFWKYNTYTDEWSRVADFPGSPRYWAAGFSIEYSGYVGTGTDASNESIFRNDFYEYRPDLDGDGWNVYVDCDDGDENINPNGFEVINGIDDDCDGSIDEPCIPPPSGMTGWWPFDANTDDMVGCRSAVLHGNTTYDAGMVRACYKLDGDGDWIEVPDDDSLNAGIGDFTLDLWVYFNSTDGQQVIAEKYIERFGSGSQGWTFPKQENTLTFMSASAPVSLSDNTWYHLAVRRSSGVASIFLNGVEVASSSNEFSDVSSSSSLKFGHRGNPDDTPGSLDTRNFYLNGKVDEAEYFGRALTDAEILAIYNARNAGKCKPAFYEDKDHDGYGSTNITYACTAPPDWVSTTGDCDDSNPEIYRFDTLYYDYDEDGYDDGQTVLCIGDTIPQGYSETTLGPDCDNSDSTIWRSTSLYIDSDGDGYDDGQTTLCIGNTIPQGFSETTLGADCDNSNNTIWRSTSLYIDSDEDGYDDGQITLCIGNTIPQGFSETTLGADCDNSNPAIHPNAPEICNGIDDDCDGQIDEGKPLAKITPLGNLDICATGSVVLRANYGVGYTYQWTKNGSNISGATQRKYSATTTGSYRVIVTSNGCSTTSKKKVVTNSCIGNIARNTSSSVNTSSQLLLYPNPTTGNINVTYYSNNNERTELRVYDRIGKILFTKTETAIKGSNAYQLNLSNLTPGIYELELSNGILPKRVKFVIEK